MFWRLSILRGRDCVSMLNIWSTYNKKLFNIILPFPDQRSILQLRNAKGMNRLIYVSCAPKLVSKNWLDLTRPCSKTMKGEPFILKKATAVDLFPHTPHMELVLVFERDVVEVATN